MLDMDLDNTFVVAYTPDDVYEVAEDMGLSASPEQATEVLTYLIDNYNPSVGVNVENFKQTIESVTGLKRLS